MGNMQNWHGVFTALVTPFTPNGEVDWENYRKLLRFQKSSQVTGVVPCGTTAETPTLTLDEKKKLIEIALEELKGSGLKVIPGTGSNNTGETVEFSKWVASKGADAILVVTPYYNKPTQPGLVKHFQTVADSAGCEVILYNVPGRTGVSLTAESIVTLAGHSKITAVKEATGNLSFASDIRTLLNETGRSLNLLSGDDPTLLPFLSVGGTGVISVASNAIPVEMVQICNSYFTGKLKAAQELFEKHYPFLRDIFVESNPAPIKAAMEMMGLCPSKTREPLAPLVPFSIEKLKKAMKHSGLNCGK